MLDTGALSGRPVGGAGGWPGLRPQPAGWLALALAASAGGALGQELIGAQGQGREYAIQPRVSITETLSSNVELSATQPLRDAITQLTAGVGFQRSGGRVRGFLDYSFSAYRHARHNELDTYQNTLSARLGSEFIDGRARLDATASIAQASLSAFGVQPGVSGLPADNLTETRSFSLAPSFYGPLGPGVQYKATLSHSMVDARSTDQGDSSNTTASLRLGPSSPAVMGWALDATSSYAEFDTGRTTVDDRLTGTLSRRIDLLDLEVNASAGIELTDLATVQRERYRNWGLGFSWVPSPRTKLALQVDERFFGRGHTLRFEHRTAMTVWTLSDSRDVSTNGDGSTGAARGPTFEQMFEAFAFERDIVKRTALANAAVKAAQGVGGSYLRSGATVVRSQAASVAYRAPRNSAVLVFNRSTTSQIDGAPVAGTDFVNNDEITVDNLSLVLTHRLTPMSSVDLTLSHQQSVGDGAGQRSRQRTVNLLYTARLNGHSDLSLGARRSLLKADQSSYDESALFATYVFRF